MYWYMWGIRYIHMYTGVRTQYLLKPETVVHGKGVSQDCQELKLACMHSLGVIQEFLPLGEVSAKFVHLYPVQGMVAIVSVEFCGK